MVTVFEMMSDRQLINFLPFVTNPNFRADSTFPWADNFFSLIAAVGLMQYSNGT